MITADPPEAYNHNRNCTVTVVYNCTFRTGACQECYDEEHYADVTRNRITALTDSWINRVRGETTDDGVEVTEVNRGQWMTRNYFFHNCQVSEWQPYPLGSASSHFMKLTEEEYYDASRKSDRILVVDLDRADDWCCAAYGVPEVYEYTFRPMVEYEYTFSSARGAEIFVAYMLDPEGFNATLLDRDLGLVKGDEV